MLLRCGGNRRCIFRHNFFKLEFRLKYMKLNTFVKFFTQRKLTDGTWIEFEGDLKQNFVKNKYQ